MQIFYSSTWQKEKQKTKKQAKCRVSKVLGANSLELCWWVQIQTFWMDFGKCIKILMLYMQLRI